MQRLMENMKSYPGRSIKASDLYYLRYQPTIADLDSIKSNTSVVAMFAPFQVDGVAEPSRTKGLLAYPWI
jgi:hypothetical protein